MIKQTTIKMVPSQLLLFTLITTLLPILSHSSDYTNLIFKGCADQNFQDFNTNYRQQLTTLITTLTTQSTTTKFYNTTTNSLTGLFQCRTDLSAQDCNRCVNKIPSMAQRLCGQAIAARIQLTGCYLSYSVSNFRQPSGTELLFKICGVSQASGAGFGERLDSALGEVVKGVVSGNGFYAGGYQSVYVLGQCEGDLSGNECGNCVKSAVDRSKSECGNSISAQVYFQQCYVSYTYYPNGVPVNGDQGGTQETVSSSPRGPGRSTQKLVAIVLGGIVGVGLVMSCLLFTKSAYKKKTRTHKFGG